MKKELIKAWEEQGFDVKVEPDRLHLAMFVGEETILYTIDIDVEGVKMNLFDECDWAFTEFEWSVADLKLVQATIAELKAN